MTGCISPKRLPQCFSSNVLFLQCNSPPTKRSVHVCGWTYGYGKNDTLYLPRLGPKEVIQLLASVKMLTVKPSFHAVRKPMESPIWGRTDSINWLAIWMSHCRRGTSSLSEAVSADAKWREVSWLHWTVFKLQIHEQNTWLLSFKLLSLGMSCFLAMVTGKILFLFISKKGIFLPPMSPPKPQHQHLEKNQTS